MPIWDKIAAGVAALVGIYVLIQIATPFSNLCPTVQCKLMISSTVAVAIVAVLILLEYR